MSKLKGIVFDLDGTIADTEEVHRLAFNTAFQEANLEWQWSRELYADLLSVAGGRERIAHYARVYWPEFRPTEFGLDDFVRQLHYAKTRIYQHMIAEGAAPLRAGVARLVAELQEAGIKLAIATSTARANVHTLMETAFGSGWSSTFPIVVTCTELKAQKPSPVVYEQALDKSGLTNRDVVAIEDTHNGYLAARNAGILTIVTTHFYTRQHEFADAALVLDSLGEPDQPFTAVGGDPRGATHVDLALLRRIVRTQNTTSQALVA
jgi:HAD superfamily hydrolase (TIGR01509 family)